MESGEETRVICSHICDICDNAVLQQDREMTTQMYDALHCVFWFLEVEKRSLGAARLKPAKTSPDTEALEIRCGSSVSRRSRPT